MSTYAVETAGLGTTAITHVCFRLNFRDHGGEIFWYNRRLEIFNALTEKVPCIFFFSRCFVRCVRFPTAKTGKSQMLLLELQWGGRADDKVEFLTVSF